MHEQRNLFEIPPEEKGARMIPTPDRFQGAMVCSAVGDALGWPTEFLKENNGRKPPFDLPIRDFIKWEKFVGGRWWGYRDTIGPGEYSDDTQLALAIARSISSTGDFEPERFAYSEFPLWLHYERGGGRSIKTAARALIHRKNAWVHNFYKRGNIDYRSAGANGAAMRNLPIALVSYGNNKRLIRDSFLNAIISHGHPRAILGTILLGLAVHYALSDERISAKNMVQFLRNHIEDAGKDVAGNEHIYSWIEEWEKKGKTKRGAFKTAFSETRKEAHQYLTAILEFIDKPVKDYYTFVGALDPSTKGSGVATICAAIYLFLRHKDKPAEPVYIAANQLGSDTDTIACLC